MVTDTVTLRLGELSDLRKPGVGSLMVDHHCEVGRDGGIEKLRPDWASYEYLEDNEVLAIWVVEIDDEVVGYTLSVYHERNLQNVDQAQLINHAIYVKPSVRCRGVGNLLMRATEDTALEWGADMVWHAPTHSRLDRILSGRSSYRPVSTTYIKKDD